jgi:hypothetical protein
MLKKAFFVFALLGLVVAFGNVGTASAARSEKVVICHSTQTSPSNGKGQGPQNNPYVQESVNQSSIANLPNGHDSHTGPVFNNTGQDFWGDIIPPFGNYPGLNWTAEGQAIYNNDCGFVTEGAFVTFDVSCGNKETVVTLTNSGQSAGTATVNGEEVAVAAGTSVTVNFDLGENIVVVINGQTVYNQTPVCSGKGSTTTKDPQVQAPKAGVNAGGGSVLALGAAFIGSVASLAYGTLRLRKLGL